MKQVTRREFVTLAALVSGSVILGGLAGCTRSPEKTPAVPAAPVAETPKPEPLKRLTIKGPQSPATVLLAHLAGQEALKRQVPEVSFGTVKNVDQLRAAIAAKELDVAAVPTNVAANLHRKGVELQLLNVTVWGTLYVMTVGDGIKDWADLKGKRVLVPLKGDIPDLVFRYLAGKAGVELTPTYVASPTEAMQLLLAGQADAAVLTEPVGTAAQIQGKQKGLDVKPALNLQQEWGKLTGRSARFPQVGTIALSHVTANAAVVEAIQSGLKTAVQWAAASPQEAAALGEQHLTDMKAPVIQASLARTPLEVLTAVEAREELEFFFARLKELSPEIIGGDLPEKSFYYGVK